MHLLLMSYERTDVAIHKAGQVLRLRVLSTGEY